MAYNIGGMVTNPEEISALFSGTEEETPSVKTPTEESGGDDTPPTEDKEVQHITEMTPEELFEEEDSEKVGNDEDNPEGEEREPSLKKEGSSPDKLYSSIANLLFEDGVLSNLSEEEVSKIENSEELGNAINKWAYSQLDAAQQRVTDALNANIPVSQIQQYENAIKYLDSVTTDQLEAENKEGEDLRKAIIYQYQLKLGLSEDRASKMVERAFAGGTDIEDAKEYLDSLKQSYSNEYNALIEEGRKVKKQQEANLNKIKDTLLKDDKILGDVVVDAKTRQLAWDYWMKPTYKTEQGTYQTELQKYIAENPDKFQMNMALIFALTDKFKNMGNLIKPTVKKEKKKALQELENVINGTRRTSGGAINFKTDDPDANFNTLTLAPGGTW